MHRRSFAKDHLAHIGQPHLRPGQRVTLQKLGQQPQGQAEDFAAARAEGGVERAVGAAEFQRLLRRQANACLLYTSRCV